MRLRLQCLLFVSIFGAAPPTKFEVTSLPGWVDDSGKPAPLPCKMYTGFLDAGTPPSGVGTMYFHYWMAQSEGDVSKDPVLIWYNGGPGASSLFGLLQEFGPLTLTELSYDDRYNKTGIPSPQLNPWRWTLGHTVVAIDSPPPIGMSFCSEQGPSGGPTSCGPWTDKTVFKANHLAHKALFALFPELKSNPFYFSGESYAGIYVPGFVDAMLSDPIPGLNFKGFLVGDGWVGCEFVPGKKPDWCINLDNVGVFKYPNVYPGPYYDVQFFHGHSQFSEQLYRDILQHCSIAELLGQVPLGHHCSDLIDQMSREVGYWFVYNLYSECPSGSSVRVKKTKHGLNRAMNARRQMTAMITGKQDYSGLSSPCLGEAMPDWLLLNETLTALGAPLDTNFINLDNGHGFNYTSDETFVGPIYERALKAGLRVLVYEGDDDACGLGTAMIEDVFVPLFASFGMQMTNPWRPWTTDGKGLQAGFVIEWDNATAQFASVRGSGHLLPLNRPISSLELVTRFTRNQPLPPYSPR